MLCISIFLMHASRSNGYKMGAPVQMLIRTPTGTVEALRSQMPLFGVPTSASIEKSSLEPKDTKEKPKRLVASLTFGGGGSASFGERTVSAPWVDVRTSDRVLETLTVTFVYCRDGDVHGVSSSGKFVDLKHADEETISRFRVEYVWIEEADIDLTGGLSVTMGVVVLVSLIILVRSCGSMEKLEEEDRGNAADGSAGYHGSAQDYSYGGYTGGASWKGE